MEQFDNRYRLAELVGQGGMAKVYRAEDAVLGRTVAVKMLREQYANDQAFLARFMQEARSAAGLSHPNIVNIFDVGHDGGKYFIVMELVDGPSLKEAILQEAPFSAERTVSIASQVCAGLQAAHGRGLVHRDIKPQNVLVTRDGQVKIADFGIARALGEASYSETGQVFGSVHYLSPEQAQGKQATPASDIYALGVVCYEMLTGRLPFEGETVVGVALRHIQEAPRPLHEINPAVPPTLESIVLRALAKNPEERFPSAREMGKALQDYARLGEQATGLLSPVRAMPPPTVSAQATRVAPNAAAEPAEEERPSRSGGNFLLLVLAILALISVLGLCALGAAVFQTYNDKFSAGLPTITVPTVLATLVPTAVSVEVPKLEGVSAAEARSAIEARKLVYKEGPPEAHDTIPAGFVVRQSIQPGSSVTPGLEVTVVLSKGRDGVTVPFVIGYKFLDAVGEIEKSGLVVAKHQQIVAGVVPDMVYDQDPRAGLKLPPGSTVTLSVGKASNKIAIPNVVGKPEIEAKRIIADAGLKNSPWPNYQGREHLPEWLLESVAVGHVLSTTPKEGTEVDPGTEVLIAVRKE